MSKIDHFKFLQTFRGCFLSSLDRFRITVSTSATKNPFLDRQEKHFSPSGKRIQLVGCLQTFFSFFDFLVGCTFSFFDFRFSTFFWPSLCNLGTYKSFSCPFWCSVSFSDLESTCQIASRYNCRQTQ